MAAVSPAGVLTDIFVFDRTYDSFGGPGWQPQTPLTIGSDGNFYGTTDSGVYNGAGGIFRLTPEGVLTNLYGFQDYFSAPDGTGSLPSPLLEDADGNFFDVTRTGGGQNGGVFEFTSAGVFNILHYFTNGPDGSGPSWLVRGKNGLYYGTTLSGGTNGGGGIFKMTADGDFTPIYSFAPGTNGSVEPFSLVEAANGGFYGVTERGGANSLGSIFKITPGGDVTTLYSFTGGTDGSNPRTQLVEDANGNFYGSTVDSDTGGWGTIFELTSADVFDHLYTFELIKDGIEPAAALAKDINGDFYGTTFYGGSNLRGMIFKVTTAGVEMPLYSFTNGIDGETPIATLVRASDGNFYGASQGDGYATFGSLFKITPAGAFAVLRTFAGGADGEFPSGMIQASDGNLYGTVPVGGANGDGAVFRMSLTGDYTNIYSFTGDGDSYKPGAEVIQGSDGNFYGTTLGDGGTFFQMTPTGVLSTLYTFTAAIGQTPQSFIQGPNGNFYGNSLTGGAAQYGTIYEITPAGVPTLLYTFTNGVDGCYPNGLTLGPDGNFYGTTSATLNGSTLINYGTAFEITPGGVFTPLYSFEYSPAGENPQALTLGNDGSFYGTARNGGASQDGTVFRLVVGAGSTPVRLSIATQGASANVSWNTQPGTNYQLQVTLNLEQRNWINLGSPLTGTGTSLTVSNTINAGKDRFYRVQVPYSNSFSR